jgi:predicted Fe-Mo cluster-binding NifX family protein
MKIAISTDGNFVSAHFGRCPNFTIVEIENGKLVKREIIDNPGHHPGYLPQFLSQHGVNCIIAGGMGQRASGLFAEQAIQTVIGADGSIDEVIDKIIAGTLQGGENICKPGLGKGYGVAKTEHQHGEGCRKEVQGT